MAFRSDHPFIQSNIGPDRKRLDKPMTHIASHSAQKELNFEISYLVARFGRRQALVAIIKTCFKGKGRPPDSVSHLSNHLRRDIGMPEIVAKSRRGGTEKV